MDKNIVLIEFEYNYFLVKCPVFIAENIKEYQQKFDTWIGDQSNNHVYWITAEPRPEFFTEDCPDGRYTLDYGVDAFTGWLNRFVLQDKTEKAEIISTHSIEERNENGHAKFPYEYDYPHIFF